MIVIVRNIRKVVVAKISVIYHEYPVLTQLNEGYTHFDVPLLSPSTSMDHIFRKEIKNGKENGENKGTISVTDSYTPE